jgi:hypothetical protein
MANLATTTTPHAPTMPGLGVGPSLPGPAGSGGSSLGGLSSAPPPPMPMPMPMEVHVPPSVTAQLQAQAATLQMQAARRYAPVTPVPHTSNRRAALHHAAQASAVSAASWGLGSKKRPFVQLSSGPGSQSRQADYFSLAQRLVHPPTGRGPSSHPQPLDSYRSAGASCTRVYVGSVVFEVTANMLRRVFDNFGRVRTCQLLPDPFNPQRVR